ncbi:hypothetical protein [Corynebacterium atypicum]|uniref:hypothetical protein n=1 Tax=Corynebacterium atypicum TaxID=191610 RepID=UPI000A69A505|nr:hypothetical protein [Corynebacterium atypicum]
MTHWWEFLVTEDWGQDLGDGYGYAGVDYWDTDNGLAVVSDLDGDGLADHATFVTEEGQAHQFAAVPLAEDGRIARRVDLGRGADSGSWGRG